MSNLVVVGFNNAADAFEMRGALAKMQAQYLIEMEDAVVVTRNETGAVQLHQAVNLTAAGAASGAFWGSLIGLLFLNPLLGAAVGAGSGALSGKLADIGINDQFMKDSERHADTWQRRALRARAAFDPRQGARRAQALCRQGACDADLVDQGQGRRTAQAPGRCGRGVGLLLQEDDDDRAPCRQQDVPDGVGHGVSQNRELAL